jgi:hypothetical protein
MKFKVVLSMARLFLALVVVAMSMVSCNSTPRAAGSRAQTKVNPFPWDHRHHHAGVN